MDHLYEYSVKILSIANSQGKPEWALTAVEQRALRYLKAFNQNFEIVPEESKPLEH